MKNPSNTPEKKAEYKAKLQRLTDDELYQETKDKIWFSAYANNNPHSCYHWQCDYTYDEWTRRDKVDRYSEAWQAVSKG
jgi:hypothetical protein